MVHKLWRQLQKQKYRTFTFVINTSSCRESFGQVNIYHFPLKVLFYLTTQPPPLPSYVIYSKILLFPNLWTLWTAPNTKNPFKVFGFSRKVLKLAKELYMSTTYYLDLDVPQLYTYSRGYLKKHSVYILRSFKMIFFLWYHLLSLAC